MMGFLLKRILQMAVVLAVMSGVIYGLLGLMPGDPIVLAQMENPHLTAEDIARLKALHGLDQPLWMRWQTWLWRALQGDFGDSRLYQRPVSELIPGALWNSLQLLLTSLLLALLIALPCGTLAALFPRSAVDYAVSTLSVIGVSTPNFWLSLLLITVFAVMLGQLPAGGQGDWRHLVLPVMALTLSSVGAYLRFVRNGLSEVMQRDFIRTARAKGLSRPQVVWRHAARNALISFITLLCLDLGSLVSGALIVETLFVWPGMGKLTYDAVMASDYNLAMACLMLVTLMTLLGNLVADGVQYLLDPRLHHLRRA